MSGCAWDCIASWWEVLVKCLATRFCPRPRLVGVLILLLLRLFKLLLVLLLCMLLVRILLGFWCESA